MMTESPFKRWRDNKGLTQVQAAAELGVKPMTYWRWEQGEFFPRKRQWPTITDVTGLRPAEVLEYVHGKDAAQ